MTRRLLPLLPLLALAPAARADVWTDPTLSEALARAELVVRGRAKADGGAAPTIPFTVDQVLKGKPTQSVIEVAGFHDPTRQTAGPTFIKAGDEMLLILLRHKGVLRIPTPTFGRFRIRAGRVKTAVLRDTYLRLDLSLDDYVRYLRLALGKVDASWLSGLRKHLRTTEPEGTKGEARARQYLGLEALAHVRVPRAEDADLVVRYFTRHAPFQLRISACRALTRVAPKRAAGRLYAIALRDPTAAVQTAAIRGLERLRPPPPGLVERLARLLPTTSTRGFSLSNGPNDPRLNKWASPKETLLRVIAQRGAAPVKDDLLAVLDEAKVPLAIFSAALRALLTLKNDAALPKQLGQRFRKPGTAGAAIYDKELCVALTKLTNKPFKADVAKWKAWLKTQ